MSKESVFEVRSRILVFSTKIKKIIEEKDALQQKMESKEKEYQQQIEKL